MSSETEPEYRKLSKSEIAKNMTRIKKWKVEKGKLHRMYKFKSFEDAISFMGRAALEVVKLDHHPEWFNVYNTVDVHLITHDLDGISDYDFALAEKFDRVASSFRAD